MIGAKVIEADSAARRRLAAQQDQAGGVGRFGVTTEYLVSADQIQIKMAQGRQAGEGRPAAGRQGRENIGMCCATRCPASASSAAAAPRHLPIEDLAQLIHDLKNAKPRRASASSWSEVGVGTVAAGRRQAKADHVVIAGHDGGTGASPWSIHRRRHALGDGPRRDAADAGAQPPARRIRVQADGQMKTGRDVVIGALLGADEFGFATAPLVAEGCIMMRKCHLNTCPVGVATQDPVLRAQVRRPARARGELLLLRRRGSAAHHGAARHPHLRRADRPQRPARHEEGASTTGRRGGSTSPKLFHQPAVRTTCRAPPRTQDHGLDRALDVNG